MTNTDIVRQFFYELWMEESLETIHHFCAPQVILHGVAKQTMGIAGKKDIAESWFNAFPERKGKILEVEALGKDLASLTWSSISVHENAFCGLAPTNKRVEYYGTCFYLIKEGKIVEYYATSNVTEALVKKGARPFIFSEEKNIDTENISHLKIDGQSLTAREIECISLWLNRYSAKGIALKLKISHRAVEDHFSSIKSKLKIKHSRQLFLKIKEDGLLGCLLNM